MIQLEHHFPYILFHTHFNEHNTISSSFISILLGYIFLTIFTFLGNVNILKLINVVNPVPLFRTKILEIRFSSARYF